MGGSRRHVLFVRCFGHEAFFPKDCLMSRLFLIIFLLLAPVACIAFADEAWTTYCFTTIEDVDFYGNYAWAAVSTGVARWDVRDGSLTWFDHNDGLPKKIIGKIFVDPEGFPWVQAGQYGDTSGKVLYHFNGIDWDLYDNNLPEYLGDLFATRDGIVWAPAFDYDIDYYYYPYDYKKGLSKFQDGQWVKIPLEYCKSVVVDTTVYNDRDVLWVADYYTVHRIDGDEMTSFELDTDFLNGRIRQLEVDTDGEVWGFPWVYGFSTNLIHYNGVGWENYVCGRDFPGYYITCLRYSPEGIPWFGTSYFDFDTQESSFAGLHVIVDGKVTTYTGKDGLLNGYISRIFFGPDGAVYAVSVGCISRFYDGVWESAILDEFQMGRDIYIDSTGTIWIVASIKETQWFKDGELDTTKNHPEFFSPDANRYYLLGDGRNGLNWIVNNTELVLHDGERFYRYQHEVPEYGRLSTEVYYDNDDSSWVVRDYMLNRYDGNGEFTHYDGLPTTIPNPCVSDEIKQLVVDESGTVWAAHFYGVVSCYDGNEWKWIDGITREFMIPDNRGGIWLASEDDEIVCWDGENTVRYDVGSKFFQKLKNYIVSATGDIYFNYMRDNVLHCIRNGVWDSISVDWLSDREDIDAMATADDGTLWALHDRGTSSYANGEWTHYDDTFSDIHIDGDGGVWTSVRYRSLYHLEGDEFVQYAAGDIRLIDEPAKDAVWMETDEGLQCWDDGEFYSFPIGYQYRFAESYNKTSWIRIGGGIYRYLDGSLDRVFDIPIPLNEINYMYVDVHERFWLATEQDGVYCLDGEDVYHYTTADGLAEYAVNHFAGNGSGDLWLCATRMGIARFNGSTSTFVGDSTGTLPNQTITLVSYPNPFNASATITFDMPESGAVTVAVYDVLGRKVSEPARETFYPAGSHAVVWPGTDGDGRPVSSGLYFVRVSRGAMAAVARMMLIR